MEVGGFSKNNPFGKATIKLLNRIRLYGWDRAMALELESPSLDTRDWCGMVVHLTKVGCSTEEDYHFAPTTAQDGTVASAYSCTFCSDTGFILRADGRGVLWSRPCDGPDCEAGERIRAGEAKGRLSSVVAERQQARIEKLKDATAARMAQAGSVKSEDPDIERVRRRLKERADRDSAASAEGVSAKLPTQLPLERGK